MRIYGGWPGFILLVAVAFILWFASVEAVIWIEGLL